MTVRNLIANLVFIMINNFSWKPLFVVVWLLAIVAPCSPLLANEKPVPPAHFKQLFDSAKALLPDNAIKAAPIALQLHRLCLENGNDSMVAKSNYLLGIINYYLSRYYQSVDFFDRALKSAHAKNSESFAEYCWNNQGVNYEILNQLPAALQAYQQSLRLAEKRGDSTSIGQSWINIGLLDSKVRHFTEAADITKRALALFTRNADTLNMALCFQNLASFSNDQQQFALADSLSKIALNLYRAINNRFGEAELVMSLGSIASARNNIRLSNQYLQQAIAITSEMEMGALLGATYQQLGDNEVVQARYQSAADYFNMAMARYQQSGAVEKFEALYLAMANLYAKTGDYQQYRQVIDKYRAFKEKNDDKVALARYDELKNLYQFEKNTQQIVQQGREIREKRKQLYQLGAFIALLLVALVAITWLYIRSRNLTRSLYDNNIARLHTSEHAIETTGESIPERRPHAALFNRIVSLMEEKKWFTQPNLSLSDFSVELGTNEKYISQAINTYSKTNFNVFVNRYRVDEAKRLMIASGDNLSIKQVAGDCGFSNNTTFYRQFKEITGLTPSTFLTMSAENSQKAE